MPTPIPIILDTDLGSDCDDAGALAVLHALADRGEATILACIYSSGRNRFGPGCMAAINAWYGRPEIPLGAAPACELGDPRNDFLEPIATATARYGHQVVSRDDVPDMTTAYRRALASAQDGSVRIVTIGHTRGVHDLLFSPADDIVPETGRELVSRKVAEWVAMGGAFPQRREKPGWNFGQMGAAQHTREVVEAWPTPIVFSGYELGLPLITGAGLQATPQDNPVREAYRLWFNALAEGRASWDQTAVLYAVRGAGDYWTLRHDGHCEIDDDGRTEWVTGAVPSDRTHKRHAFLVEKMPPVEVTKVIEELMVAPPRRRMA